MHSPALADPPRALDLLVISDVHLGTLDCKAEALLAYLTRIAPAEVVLNGDIVDLREMRQGFWPASHAAVLQRLFAMAEAGIPVHYVTGNHDELLRRFSPFSSGTFRLCNHLERILDGRRTWIVHGDGIEHAIPMNRMVRRMCCLAYHAARRTDRLAHRLGLKRLKLVRLLKGTGKVSRHIDRFEEACAQSARRQGFDCIVTGHIHAARVRDIPHEEGTVRYLNSGDWVDSMTALEYTRVAGWRLARPGVDGIDGIDGIHGNAPHAPRRRRRGEPAAPRVSTADTHEDTHDQEVLV